jgi:hypothetical protein
VLDGVHDLQMHIHRLDAPGDMPSMSLTTEFDSVERFR